VVFSGTEIEALRRQIIIIGINKKFSKTDGFYDIFFLPVNSFSDR
jgi:hypothetical protein